MKKVRLFPSMPVLLLFLHALTASAGGPSGGVGAEPRKFPASAFPMTYLCDQGSLGIFNNAQAIRLADYGFGQWDAVPTAALSFVNGGKLPRDVNSASDALISGSNQFSDGVNPVVFDNDGSIIDARLGSGASNMILGIGGSGSNVVSEYVEGYAIINGKLAKNLSDSVSFREALTHEIGHLLGLGHSQSAMHGVFATMYPTPMKVDQQVVLSPDDIAAISLLYPASGYLESVGSISGYVRRSDGTALSGVIVIAVNATTGDAYSTVVDYYSGGASTYYSPPTPNGAYTIGGLPVGTYYVHIEPIGGISGVFSAQGRIASYNDGAPAPTKDIVPEWYNGIGESGDLLQDNANEKTPVTVGAGKMTSGIGIVANETSAILASFYYNSGAAYEYQVTEGKHYATRYTAPTDGSVVGVKFLIPAGSTLPIGSTLHVTVYKNNNGVPGQALGAVHIPFSDLSSDRENYVWLRGIGTGAQFKSGEDFHIGLSATGSGSLHILSDAGGSGTRCSRGDGTNWYAVDYSFVMTAVYTNAAAADVTPEPLALNAQDNASATLSKCKPNPFITRTTIEYTLKQRTNVQLELFTVYGKKVTTLDEGMREAGTYRIELSGDDIAPGAYFYTLRAGSFSSSRELVRLK